MAFPELLRSFSLILMLELGDKSQLATLLLTGYYNRPVSVLLGAAAAHLLAMAMAVGGGQALPLFLPLSIIKYLTASLFIAIGLITLFHSSQPTSLRFLSGGVGWTSFLVILGSELGDKSWFMALTLSASSGHFLEIFLGAFAALFTTSLLAVMAGDTLLKKIRLRWIRVATGLFFLASGLLMLL